MTVFDSADWHDGGDFPTELPASAAATHIGMFLSWCAQRGLLQDPDDQMAGDLAALSTRALTPGEFALSAADGVLHADLLSDEGRMFTASYYGSRTDEENDEVRAEDSFDDDYVDVFLDDGDTIYHVRDSWESYDRISPVLDRRHEMWRQQTPSGE